jgi:signal transduction histidine kinase
LRELDSHTAFARCIADLGTPIAKALTFNPYDVPFALVYFCSTDFGTNTLYTGSTNPGSTLDIGRRTPLQSSQSGSVTGTDRTDPSVWAFHLQSTVGIPDGHILAPKTVEINLEKFEMGSQEIDPEEGEVHVWPFRKMAEQQTAIDIRNITPEMLAGITHQGWPELPKEAIAIPIQGGRDFAGKDSMMGMLVLGINPRRAFDQTYQTFARMCGRQIASSMMMVRNIEEESSRAEDLAALNRDRTSFFQSVSHELRTPLTLVLGPLDECIDDPSLSQQHKSRLDMVRRNARRLLRLVNSLLDFSRVEAGKMGAAFKETNLQKYTADLASLFRSAIEKGGVKYVVDTSGKERTVWVDRDMWEVRACI